jgi:hypothetical protein
MDGWERSHSMGGKLAGLIAEARPELRHVAIGVISRPDALQLGDEVAGCQLSRGSTRLRLS